MFIYFVFTIRNIAWPIIFVNHKFKNLKYKFRLNLSLKISSMGESCVLFTYFNLTLFLVEVRLWFFPKLTYVIQWSFCYLIEIIKRKIKNKKHSQILCLKIESILIWGRYKWIDWINWACWCVRLCQMGDTRVVYTGHWWTHTGREGPWFTLCVQEKTK